MVVTGAALVAVSLTATLAYAAASDAGSESRPAERASNAGAPLAAKGPASTDCVATTLGALEGALKTPVKIRYLANPSGSLFFEAGLAIDADGGRHAYRDDDKGLDTIKNACPRDPAKVCFGILEPTPGNRVRQAAPNQAYYVSPTTLQDPSKPKTDQARYVDSETIAYLALPVKSLQKMADAQGISNGSPKLGDVAFVRNRHNGKTAFAIIADVGPSGKIGEGSIALAQALGIPSSPRHGGAADGVEVLIFIGSGNRRPRPQADIDAAGASRLGAWGGEARLTTCLADGPN